MAKIIRRMTATEVIEKQEEYRKATIDFVGTMLATGMERKNIAKEVGISASEVSAIEKMLEPKKIKHCFSRRFF
jgi:hypothetical protein